jgi:hypothetical protein
MRAAIGICVMVFLAGTVSTDGASPLEKVKRSIAKEPSYNAKEPRYALAAFGPEAKTTVWLVLDKSKGDGKRYDLLYADLNGNGDLTELGERFSAEEGDTGNSRFKLPDIKDTANGQKHTDFTVGISDDNKPRHMVSLRWRSDRELGGGYPVDPEKGYMRFATSAETAPIVWFNGDGPVQFQRWISGPLTIGGETDLSLFLGYSGSGANSFCAYRQYVLPEGEGIRATLRYKDKEGKKREAVSELTDRC